jgi:D-tyrosyl-tRNA(Tyr) deacylase
VKAVVQRVRDATVTVSDAVVGQVASGLLVYFGVARGDTYPDVEYMARKILALRIFDDADGRMNRSISDLRDAGDDAGVLVVSQFTLLGDVRKGNRPSYNNAEDPDVARALYQQFIELVRGSGIRVATGSFGEHMDVQYVNDGPVTILLES